MLLPKVTGLQREVNDLPNFSWKDVEKCLIVSTLCIWKVH